PLSSPPSRSVSPNPSIEQGRGPLPSFQAFPPKATARKHRIPRPKAAGRLELSKVVDWEKNLAESIKACSLSLKHLDSAKSFKQQDEEKIALVRKKMVAKYAVLDNYVATWPIDHILISQLKYSSAHTKGSNVKSMVASVRSAVAGSKKTEGQGNKSMSSS
ncbi:hypothetical protein DXG01_009441, partial [Tephrocybe rancida]